MFRKQITEKALRFAGEKIKDPRSREVLENAGRQVLGRLGGEEARREDPARKPHEERETGRAGIVLRDRVERALAAGERDTDLRRAVEEALAEYDRTVAGAPSPSPDPRTSGGSGGIQER